MSLKRDDFTVGWVCAVDIELSAVRGVLDEKYETKLPVPGTDKNLYEYGQIGGHKVVITVLPSFGIGPAGVVATRMSSTFPNLRFILMVGVAGGAPSETNDIRLGDIVISKAAGRCSGVVQYDFGKTIEGGGFQPIGWFNAPPQILTTAALALKARGKGKLGEDIWKIFTNGSFSKDFAYPGQEEDTLYEPDCLHAREEKGGKSVAKNDCGACDKAKIYRRTPERRPNDHPHIHYGIMASANNVMKDGKKRNEVIQKTAEWAGAEPLCFEMEAAGLMNDFPCLIVRGICDYSDAHKNKNWQPYAAINAAICARELLKQVSPMMEVGLVDVAKETLKSVSTREINFVFQDSMPFHIPYPRNTTFEGRKGTLETLHECFTKQQYRGATPLICTVTGTSGIGKTQIAIEYAYQHLTEYKSVFWISATSEETIHASLIKIMECIIQEHARVLWEDSVPDYKIIAQQFRLGELVDNEGKIKAGFHFFAQIRAAFFDWLAMRPKGSDDKKWLLIFDDVEDSEARVFQSWGSLPDHGNGAILITSRRPDILQEHRVEKNIGLEGLEAGNAVNLLLASANLQNPRDVVKEQATAIVTELGFLPLAISQAGYYIRENKLGLEEYLPLYRGKFMEVQGLERQPEGSSYQETIVTTWGKIFQTLKKQDEDAASVLLTSAYFHPKEICESIWVDDRDGKPDERVRIRFERTMSVLASYSLVKRGPEQSQTSRREERTRIFSVHPVIQSWARGRLKRDGQTEPLRDAVILLGKVSKWKRLSQKSRQWNLEEERRLTAHIRSLSSHSVLKSFGILEDEAQKHPDDNLYFAFANIGKRLEKQERYAEALPWLKEAHVGLTVQKDEFERLAILNSIGTSLTHERQCDEALKYFLQGLDMLVSRLWVGQFTPQMTGPELVKHSIVFKLMNNMGTAYYRQNPANYETALHWIRKAYYLSTLLGDKDMLKYDIRQNSTKITRKLNIQEATFDCNIMISGLQQWKASFAKSDDFQSFDVTFRIASLFEDQGRYDIAVNWYRDAITSFGQGLARNHPHRVKAFRHYGKCLGKLKQHDEAKKWYDRALEGFKELNGEDHRDRKYFYLLGKKAKSHGNLEEYDEALKLSLEVLSGTGKLPGVNKEATIKALEKVSKYHRKLKNYDEALTFAQQRLELGKEMDGLNGMSLQTVGAMGILTMIYEKKGDYRTAAYWSMQVLDGYQKILGPSNPITCRAAERFEALKARSENAIPPHTNYSQPNQQSTYPAAPPQHNGNQAGYQPGYQAAHPGAAPPPAGYQAGKQGGYPGSPPPTGQPYQTPPTDPRYGNQMNPQGYPYAHGQYPQNQYPQSQYPQNQFAQGQFAQGQYAQNQYAQNQFVQNQYGQGQYVQNQLMPFNPIPQFQHMSFR
ncbi:hypothetical protein TWF569_010171 [Orbilia oligospora]|nr:hypothetical protein TWF569_010171 [Orbilia oligospora]